MLFDDTTRRRFLVSAAGFGAAAALPLAFTRRALALDAAHRDKAHDVADRAAAYLMKQQNDDGSWAPKPGPGVTALVVAGLLRTNNAKPSDPAVAKAIDYVISRQKDDGGIYDSMLGNYNTSIALMMLGQLEQTDRIQQVVKRAQDYLRGLQWHNQQDPTGTKIAEDHPWFGGAGYGNKGRPDLSNTATMIAGLRDSGLDCKDPAYLRAMAFVTSLQGAKANTRYGDQIVPDGGFIYATSENKDAIGKLQSYAVPDTTTDAFGKSRLRTYGSMTYAGFMSYLYAQLDREDPRVLDALNWIKRNYTLDHNPGMGDIESTEQDERFQGYYYYLHLFARALSAWTRGEPRGVEADPDTTTITLADGEKRDWANDLIARIAELQKDDGRFENVHDRWMESDPVLCTAYALNALGHTLG